MLLDLRNGDHQGLVVLGGDVPQDVEVLQHDGDRVCHVIGCLPGSGLVQTLRDQVTKTM